jgi:hypothetical protein
MQLVINTFGASLRKQSDRFLIQAGQKQFAVSAHKVQSIRITTGAHLSTDAIESAHRTVGGTGRGRKYATQQLNRAYATLLSSQFQGFCQDLYSECVDHILNAVNPAGLRNLLREQFIWERRMDRGNPTVDNIRSDFNRFGLQFWDEIRAEHAGNQRREAILRELNEWRNAIARQDFTRPGLSGRTTLHLHEVKSWRRAVHRLAQAFDKVMGARLEALLGAPPW